MTTINLVATDQVLTVAQKPVTTAGNQNTVQLQVETDTHWSGYALSAVFFTAADPTVYEAVLTGASCTIPAEVLAMECLLYIGIRGVQVNGNKAKVKTSTLVQYKIEAGAPAGTGTAVPPTADVYQQLLAAYAIERARIDNLVNIKGDSNAVGSATLTLSNVGSSASGTVMSDGIHAVIQLSGLNVSIGGNSSIQIATLPAEFAALCKVEQRHSMSTPIYYRVQGTALYVCCDDTGQADGIGVGFSGGGANILYPLAAIALPEILDARVGYGGTTYGTIGTAVREQVKALHDALDGMKTAVTLADQATGKTYSLYVSNGKLTMAEKEE